MVSEKLPSGSGPSRGWVCPPLFPFPFHLMTETGAAVLICGAEKRWTAWEMKPGFLLPSSPHASTINSLDLVELLHEWETLKLFRLLHFGLFCYHCLHCILTNIPPFSLFPFVYKLRQNLNFLTYKMGIIYLMGLLEGLEIILINFLASAMAYDKWKVLYPYCNFIVKNVSLK